MYTIHVENEKQLRVVQDLEVNRDGIHFMDTPNKVPQKVEMIVPPHQFARISELLENHHINYVIKIENMQKWGIYTHL